MCLENTIHKLRNVNKMQMRRLRSALEDKRIEVYFDWRNIKHSSDHQQQSKGGGEGVAVKNLMAMEWRFNRKSDERETGLPYSILSRVYRVLRLRSWTT